MDHLRQIVEGTALPNSVRHAEFAEQSTDGSEEFERRAVRRGLGCSQRLTMKLRAVFEKCGQQRDSETAAEVAEKSRAGRSACQLLRRDRFQGASAQGGYGDAETDAIDRSIADQSPESRIDVDYADQEETDREDQ